MKAISSTNCRDAPSCSPSAIGLARGGHAEDVAVLVRELLAAPSTVAVVGPYREESELARALYP